VKARLVRRAAQWPWSSAAAHVAGRGDAVCEGAWLAERIAGWVCTLRQYLAQADEQSFASAMRTRENTGRPFGEKAFLQQIGALLAPDLLPKKPGRKRKEEK